MIKHFLSVMCIMAMGGLIAEESDQMTISENGKSRCAIVTNKNTSEADKFALKELKEFLAKATGAEFQTIEGAANTTEKNRIYLGIAPDGTKLKDGESMVQTRNGNLYLYGEGKLGNVSAVYNFLENHLGFRWYNAYGDNVKIPHIPDLRLNNIDKKYTPGLPYRALMTFLYNKKSEGTLFFCRNRQNFLLKENELNIIVPIGLGHHSFLKFMPPEKYFKSNPEFYTMNKNGQRVTGAQLCFSNNNVRKTMIENILARMKDKYKKAAAKGQSCWIEVSVSDVLGSFCHCPECKKLEEKYQCPGGAFYDYLPELCAEIKKQMPSCYITTLLYRKSQTEKPPAGMILPDNFIGIFAPIDNNILAPMTDPSNADTLKNLKNWCKIAKNIWVWYYPQPYNGIAPYSALRRNAEDFLTMKNAGITGTFYEHDVTVVNSDNFADMESWVLLKLFSGAVDYEKLIQEFINDNYGKAAPLMTKYFNDLENGRTSMVENGFCGNYDVSTDLYSYLTPENMERWSRMFDEMENLVKSDSGTLFRVKLVRRTLDRAIVRKWTAFEKTSYAKSKSKNEFIDRIMETDKRIASERKSGTEVDPVKEKIYSFLKTAPQHPDLKGIDEKSIEQIFLMKKGVKDESAIGGYATNLTPGIPFKLYASDYKYVLDKDKISAKWKTLATRSIKKDEIKADSYQLYKLGRVKGISPATRLHVTDSAEAFTCIGYLFDPSAPETEWDIYFSMKFEGPLFPGSKAAKNSILCDRIILVKQGK